MASKPRVAEFFAGVGLVRIALEQHNCRVVFANDISEKKRQLYAANFSVSDIVPGDVRDIRGSDVPLVDMATASFPCTDLSLAGGRAGLAGRESGVLREFLRILGEMEEKPAVVLLENVPGFATSRKGDDLRSTIKTLNNLGYACDLLALDAKNFVPQSRRRLFVIGSLCELSSGDWQESILRPLWIREFVEKHPQLRMSPYPIPEPPDPATGLKDVVERFPSEDSIWWDHPRRQAFLDSLSPIQSKRLLSRIATTDLSWATAYRRTRDGTPVWEIRSDAIAGCLRTTRGGSSKQALVEAGRGDVRIRWMTAREYCRLQGVPSFEFGGATESQIRFGLGDAVCVPVVAWLAEHYLIPAVKEACCHA